MPASSTDKFKKGARKWVGQIGAGGVSDDTVATIPLASTTGLPTDTAVVAVIDRVDSSGTKTPSLEETVVGVVSGSNLVTATRGAEGTAQVHSAGAVVEILITNKGWNDIVDGILVGHNQDGTHKSGSVLTLPQINDTSSDHQYVFSVCELTADRTVALPLLTGNDEFVFKDHTQTLANKTLTSPVLNTGVSGTAIVDEDTMSSDSATKVPTQQSVKAYVDARTGDGWLASTDTWTYASASTFTIAGVDRTGVYTKGTRLKFTQTSAKYAVVVSSSFSTDTTVTIAVNTDYVIANAAITSPYYSYMDNPVGYPTHFAYTPAFTGFTGTVPTGTFRYAIIGKTCWVTIFGDTPGASNATGFTVGVPIAAVSTSAGVATTYDNGAWQTTPGRIVITNGQTAISVTKDATGAAFTGSGNKTAIFQMVYGC